MSIAPTHLEAFNRDRALRIEARDRAVAVGVLERARAEAARLVREARAYADKVTSDAVQDAKERVRAADLEAKKTIRDANDLLAKGERAKRAGEKSLETARNRARIIREQGHAQKRSIITSAKACTGDVELLYAAADRDAKRIVSGMKLAAHRECQAMRLAVERDAKLIREKARAEGLAFADMELERRALRDLGLSSVRGRR